MTTATTDTKRSYAPHGWIPWRLQVSFLNPAFLGNAEQNGQWRTPPFKHLLREWWRVVKAKEVGYDHAELRKQEGALFGHAWLKHKDGHREKTWAMQSQVRLRLEPWERGGLTEWKGNWESKLIHPEVKNRNTGRQMPVGAHLYLGYGSLIYNAGATKPKFPAIESGRIVDLVVSCRDEFVSEIGRAIQLASWFGTLGGRSRNGWGSLLIQGNDIEGPEKLLSGEAVLPVQNWEKCLKLEWAHAIGQDEKGPLTWKLPKIRTWSEAMRTLAQIKIKLRTHFKFTAPDFGTRHVFAYPVTRHSVAAWGKDSRLANRLRFRLVRMDDQFIPLIYHMPAVIPEDLAKKLQEVGKMSLPALRTMEREVWAEVHDFLDDYKLDDNKHADRVQAVMS